MKNNSNVRNRIIDIGMKAIALLLYIFVIIPVGILLRAIKLNWMKRIDISKETYWEKCS